MFGKMQAEDFRNQQQDILMEKQAYMAKMKLIDTVCNIRLGPNVW